MGFLLWIECSAMLYLKKRKLLHATVAWKLLGFDYLACSMSIVVWVGLTMSEIYNGDFQVLFTVLANGIFLVFRKIYTTHHISDNRKTNRETIQ